jgi:hypothetical protein
VILRAGRAEEGQRIEGEGGARFFFSTGVGMWMCVRVCMCARDNRDKEISSRKACFTAGGAEAVLVLFCFLGKEGPVSRATFLED